MPDVAYVNGSFSPLADAVINIEDRGFQFADGIYEVIVAPHGRPFLLEDHLTRLARSARMVELPYDPDATNMAGVIEEGIKQCGHENVMIYIQITRGVAPRDHVFKPGIKPTIVATFKPMPTPKPEWLTNGVEVETADDIRWAWPHVKSIALLPNILLKNGARQRGRHDAIILGPGQMVRETTCANVFIVEKGKLLTPPASDVLLHGVTRKHILDCASRLQIPCREKDIHLDRLLEADEVLITSTTMTALPVVRVDEAAIANGKPGPIAAKIRTQFLEDMQLTAANVN